MIAPTRRRFLIAAAVAATAVPAVAAAGLLDRLFGGPEPTGVWFTDDGLAIRGYDPVAYFTQSRPVEGDAAHAANWQGVEWRFASAEHRERFLANPEAYAPQYGGYCAWAVAAKGEAYPIDPTAWRIVDDRLYLNFSHDVQETWEEDIPGFIERGDARWPGLAERLAAGTRG